MTLKITGDKALDRKLKRLASKTARKVLVAGTKAEMRIIVKGIKSEIPPSARKAIGMKFKKTKRGEIIAKVGAAVGKIPRTNPLVVKCHFRGQTCVGMRENENK